MAVGGCVGKEGLREGVSEGVLGAGLGKVCRPELEWWERDGWAGKISARPIMT